MRQELIDRIRPMIDEFVDKTINQLDGVDKIRKSLRQKETELNNITEEQDRIRKELKDKLIEKQIILDSRITDAENARKKFESELKRYDDLHKELELAKSSIEAIREKTNTEYAIARDKSESADRELEEARKQRNRYELMVMHLEKDDIQNKKDKEFVQAELDKLHKLKLDIERKEAKVIEQSNNINDKELELKVREKEVERQIRRYNLKQIIGAE